MGRITVNKKEKKPKPKYNMFQNVGFMLKTAAEAKEKKIFAITAALILLSVGNGLLSIYAAPLVIRGLQENASLQSLLLTVLWVFSSMALIDTAYTYINVNAPYPKISVRMHILKKVNEKACTVSFQSRLETRYRELSRGAYSYCSNNNSATEAIWNTLFSLGSSIIGFVVFVVMLTAVQPVLLAIVVVTSLIGYFSTNYINGYGYRHREERDKTENRRWYVNDVTESLEAAKDIRIFNMQPWLTALAREADEVMTAFHRKAASVYIWSKIIDLVLTFLQNGAAYVYLIGAVVLGRMDVATFTLCFAVVGNFTGRFTEILGGFNTLYRQSLDISALREFLEYPEPFRFEGGVIPEHIGTVELRNVSYRYPGTEKDVLSGIDLTLRPGERLAIVGLNGAGKTTLARIVCGLLDPTEGTVLVNGVDLKEYNRGAYYKCFSAVFQDFSILAETIARNISQTDGEQDMAKVISCAKQAGIDEKISSLKDGYETHLNRSVYDDAIDLSGGEKQRLMLARALYKDGEFLLLDEPTAALDPLAEADIYNKYNEITAGKTAIYISHRLASTRFCDRIILLDGAVIAEEGTHEELISIGGKYAEFFEVQSRYYREEGGENEEE